MFNLPQTRHCDFTIRCKKCGENIPAPVGTMPDSWIAAQCPLCGEKRNYLPSEIFQGNLSYKLGPKPVRLSGALMGEMKRAIAREREAWAEQMQEQTRMKSTLVIAAAIIAAVRLARDPDISRPSPRLTAVVSDSVNLARMILDRVGRQ